MNSRIVNADRESSFKFNFDDWTIPKGLLMSMIILALPTSFLNKSIQVGCQFIK